MEKTLPFYTTLAILQYFGYYQPESKKFPKGLVAWTTIWLLGLLNLLVLIITRLHGSFTKFPDGNYMGWFQMVTTLLPVLLYHLP